VAAREQIRVIIAKEGDCWIAQCLEYDIGAQASDPDQLRDRLVATLNAEYQESMKRQGKPFAGIDPAPQHFHELWNSRSKIFTATVQDDPYVDIEFALAA